MRKISSSALVATLLFTTLGCEPDYCSCAAKRGVVIEDVIPVPEPDVWCPVGYPENDAQIRKLLTDKCISIPPVPFKPVGNSGFQPILFTDYAQWPCARKLLFEAAVRGEVIVVFGHPAIAFPYTQPSTGDSTGR